MKIISVTIDAYQKTMQGYDKHDVTMHPDNKYLNYQYKKHNTFYKHRCFSSKVPHRLPAAFRMR